MSTIGFTNDGKVFFTDKVNIEGREAQMTFFWTAREAEELADHLKTAAKEVRQKSLIVAPNGLHL